MQLSRFQNDNLKTPGSADIHEAYGDHILPILPGAPRLRQDLVVIIVVTRRKTGAIDHARCPPKPEAEVEQNCIRAGRAPTPCSNIDQLTRLARAPSQQFPRHDETSDVPRQHEMNQLIAAMTRPTPDVGEAPTAIVNRTRPTRSRNR